MTPDVPIGINDSAGRDNYKLEKTSFDPKSPYRCHLAISRDEDGSVSVVVLNLPGAGSCGKTEEEAIANAREAIQGVIESYLEDGEEIPWRDQTAYSAPPSASQKWILVNA